VDPVRSQARKFAILVILVAVVVLGLFEAIAHRGEGPDAPGATSSETTAPAPMIPAPGQP
jgi:hypothetical protein